VDNPRSTPDSDRQSGTAPSLARELELVHADWRACNYLAVGMIYLQDNPLLRQPLRVEDVKQRLLGHWGASPALSFVWAHLNRLIVKHDLDMMFVAGPGHGAPGVLGPAYLEGTKGCEGSSSSSRFPDTSAAMSHRRRQDPSTRAASSATACRTPTGWRSTTPI
jgi:phosphoketolase